MGENEDKSQESETESFAGEKENNNKPALNTETAINNDTKTGNDKVRELLGPKLTPEERERKRKELNEKQKKALQRAEEARSRVSNEVDADATQSSQPRENLILQAVKFLSSPQVRNADEEKKIKFLLNKGLTRAEIDIAKARVDKGQLPAFQDANSQVDSVKIAQLPTGPPPVPPPVPPRTYQMMVKRAPLWKHVILALLITGAFSAAMIAAIKKFLGPAVTAIIFAKQQLFSHQLNLFRRFNESLSTILSLRKSSKPAVRSNIDDDDESPTPYEVDTPPTLLAPLATDLSELTEKLSNHQKSLTKYDTMPDLQLSLTSLAAYLSSSVYAYSSLSSSNDRDSSASQVRSEIRSLKGMLINRKNFPKIPPVPAYSAQSQQSSFQLQQQQVNTANED